MLCNEAEHQHVCKYQACVCPVSLHWFHVLICPRRTIVARRMGDIHVSPWIDPNGGHPAVVIITLLIENRCIIHSFVF